MPPCFSVFIYYECTSYSGTVQRRNHLCTESLTSHSPSHCVGDIFPLTLQGMQKQRRICDWMCIWSTSFVHFLTFSQNQEELFLTPPRFLQILFLAQICLLFLQHAVNVDPHHKAEIPLRDEPGFSLQFGTACSPHPGSVGGWRPRCTDLLGPGGGRHRRDTKGTIIPISKCSMRLAISWHDQNFAAFLIKAACVRSLVSSCFEAELPLSSRAQEEKSGSELSLFFFFTYELLLTRLQSHKVFKLMQSLSEANRTVHTPEVQSFAGSGWQLTPCQSFRAPCILFKHFLRYTG